MSLALPKTFSKALTFSLLVFAMLSSFITKAQTITTGTNTGSPFQEGNGIRVPFTATGFTTGNIFTAQLSDTSGSFATHADIGSLSSLGTGADTISATIPFGTITSAGYRIRVVAS